MNQNNDPLRFLAQVCADYASTLSPSLRESLLARVDQCFGQLIEERNNRASGVTDDGHRE